MKKVVLLLVLVNISFAQKSFSRKDSLRGGLRFERTCFDVKRYDLNLKINPDQKSIVGFNEISFQVIDDTKKIQLDLFSNMIIDSIIVDKSKLKFVREYDAVFIDFNNTLLKNSNQKITVFYHGNPTIAKNAPWDGGFVFKKSASGKPWIGVACQGDGASLWYPCKDSQTDEPDFGATIKIAVPNGLMNVSNGRFKGSLDIKNGYTRWDWEVVSPINTYDITVNIADYVSFQETYKGLDLSYYVLPENLEKAKKQFEQVKPMMDCFQSKFGEYPFKTDGYKLVETTYLGMEHQSAVAYGNGYQNGYRGSDLSGTGVGLDFDFIIIHESGHEWFGNSITANDVADMWLHESFTCYSESVFIECTQGYEKAQTYINGLKKNIQNDKPIIGQFGVANEGSGDMYYKGALMLNSIRHIVNNDELWWKTLKLFAETFRHQNIDGKTAIIFFNKELKLDLSKIFEQYLTQKDIPTLSIEKLKDKFCYQWKNVVSGFEMPVEIKFKNKGYRINGTTKPKKWSFNPKNLIDVTINSEKFLFKIQ